MSVKALPFVGVGQLLDVASFVDVTRLHWTDRMPRGRRIDHDIQQHRQSLPIFQVKDEFLKLVKNNPILIVEGGTGCGKTTQMTQYLDEAGYTSHGKIACTQPRRIAAMSVAARVSREYGCKLGQHVGYTVRFKNYSSHRTKIHYMTEGILLREIRTDPYLSQYSVIILDESHERHSTMDILFTLVRNIAIHKGSGPKLIVTSATLYRNKFSKFFNRAPVFQVPQTPKVKIVYQNIKHLSSAYFAPFDEARVNYVRASLATVVKIIKEEPKGDILVFLTGENEIELACDLLSDYSNKLLVCPAYASLDSDDLMAIFEPTPEGKTKVVIATNIAETSLTIDDIVYVVDCGLCKEKVYEAKRQMDILKDVEISQAQAIQRTGRAGRTCPGKCYRLYDESTFKSMRKYVKPEIQKSSPDSLSGVVLQLKSMEIKDVLSFDWMDKPSPMMVNAAVQKLLILGALDDKENLTPLGDKMSEFPLEPSLSKMLIVSSNMGCSEEMVTIVSILCLQTSIFKRVRTVAKGMRRHVKAIHKKLYRPEGDHITFLSIYNEWADHHYSNGYCLRNFLHRRNLYEASDIREQLIQIMARQELELQSCRSTGIVQMAICTGYPSKVARMTSSSGSSYTTAGHQDALIHWSSTLYGQAAQYVVYNDLILTTARLPFMTKVSVIKPEWNDLFPYPIPLLEEGWKKVRSARIVRNK